VEGELHTLCLTRECCTGRSNAAVLEYLAGSNEPLTNGKASPDRVVLDRLTGDILEDARHSARLPVELVALVEQFFTLEARYGRPLDIEWAFAEQVLFILQVRPIVDALPDRRRDRISAGV
jgi:phosphoenolpyruvate synthase/pyruvate phosphate dikinase